MAKTISFYLVYSFSLKKYNFIEKTKFYSKKSERIYRKERFVKKNSNEFPKLLGICEFCKKPCIRNCYGRLTVKLKKDVKNVFFSFNIFIFLMNRGSFQGQGDLGHFRSQFSFIQLSLMASAIFWYYWVFKNSRIKSTRDETLRPILTAERNIFLSMDKPSSSKTVTDPRSICREQNQEKPT